MDDAVHRTLPRDVQYHPATDQPLHVDFMRIGADTRVTVTVPVAFINHEMSIGLRRGGILNIVRHGIALICHVDNIPEQLVVDLDGLDIDELVAAPVTYPALPLNKDMTSSFFRFVSWRLHFSTTKTAIAGSETRKG